MTPRLRALLIAVGAFALAALGWFVAGWIVQAAGVAELDLPARAGGVFLALSLGQAALGRFFTHATGERADG